MAEQQGERRRFIFGYAERLEDELEETQAKLERIEAEMDSTIARERDQARLWRGRATDLKATINGIVMHPESSRQDVQSNLLLAMQRNEW